MSRNPPPKTTPAPLAILELVDRFERNVEVYKSGRYNETQLRREFLDPFFEALGWDIDNKQGYAEAYKDVVHEDSIKIGGVTKAPDYSFRVGGTRKFFVEAKRPMVVIKDDVHPAFQLRRYAWSAKLPLSILTDFEELAIYDCRVRPDKADKASTARILYLTYKEYATRWGEIAVVFSRDAVLKGSFDRYAESTKQKRGTAEVDDAFLAEIERWRELLAKNIAARNLRLTQADLNFAVQRIIDRIVFLRICEDRGIEDYAKLQAITNGAGVYKRLCERFQRADEKYNSGLFHFRREKGRHESPDEITPNISIDDAPLRDIVGNLYYPESPYEFSALPADILGQVYERFLGKVIRLTAGHKAVVEEKPEVRKAGGVYYTPTYIVEYIVRATVGKRLEGRSPKQAARLRMVDPACGSGSFLLGAYQYLLDWHRDWYMANEPQRWAKGKSPALFQDRRGEWRLTTAKRKEILINNVFGVDVDAQAVEVTKLSLLLKVLEGETEETISKNLLLFQQRALPDLGDNIKCGNSLISSDFHRTRQPSLLGDDASARVNAFDWEREFPAVFKKAKAKDDAPAARRKPGFDVVVGNPPYVRIHRIGHEQSDYIYTHYETPTSKTDLSLVFLERALSLVNPTGLIGFISTSQWLMTDYGKKMRRALSDGRLHELIDFGSLPVFVGANTYPAIFLLSPRPAEVLEVRKVAGPQDLSVAGIESTPVSRVPLASLSEAPWRLGGADIPAILERTAAPWKPLGSFGKAYIGAKSGLAEAFVVTREEAKSLKLERGLLLPYAYQGVEVRRYGELVPGSQIIYPYREGADGDPILVPEDDLRRKYPNIHARLSGFKVPLRERMDSRRRYATGSDWYRYLRAGSFRYIRPSKLVFKGIALAATVARLGEDTAFDGANCPSVIIEDYGGHDPSYLLAILNSKLMSYYLRSTCPAKLGGYVRFSASYITSAPIRSIDFAKSSERKTHKRIAGLGAEMVKMADDLYAARNEYDRTRLERHMGALDREIDVLIYELYGLTDDERSMVEASSDHAEGEVNDDADEDDEGE